MTMDPNMTVDPNASQNIYGENNYCLQNSNVVCHSPTYGDTVHGELHVPEESSNTINMSEFRTVMEGRCLKMTPDVHTGLTHFITTQSFIYFLKGVMCERFK